MSGHLGTSRSLQQTVATLGRMESPSLIARLSRMLGDVGRAEELVQDVLVTALEQWPQSGLPDNPAAWLMTAARRRAIDEIRRRRRAGGHAVLLLAAGAADAATGEGDPDDDIGDDLLRLIFIACHPLLAMEARAALTLRLLGGLSIEEIARAFLVDERTVQQRIVRAKRTLAEARVPFELPADAQRAERLDSVLQVIYLIFNEGYSATAGDCWLRPALCEEALRLGRVLVQRMPMAAEAQGLLALMELQSSRNQARVDARGAPVLLLEQNRARWDPLLIRRGLDALERAAALAQPLGRYALQAAIAACHARARRAADTDWGAIVALYDALAEAVPSPVVALNRAVAIAMAYGPAAALPLVDALRRDSTLDGYHLLPSVRGDLLEKLGRLPEASLEYQQAAAQTQNLQERGLLLARAAACGQAGRAH